MKTSPRILALFLVCAVAAIGDRAWAQDWPQWRGPNRDAKVAGFEAPAAWPQKLTQKWKVTIGDGVSSPALAGNRLYVLSREGANEVTRCLDAATGNEIWSDKLASAPVTGAAGRFPGPRSSPTVADGKVLTLEVNGTLTCFDAAKGAIVWRKDDFKKHPRFFSSCSPIVVNGICIVQLGGEDGGAIVAYDLANGNQKWKWDGDGTAYASPVLFTMDGLSEIVAETNTNIVGVSLDRGTLQWKVPFAVSGRGYNAATPVVDGSAIIFSGNNRGTRAVKLEKAGGNVTAKELWSIKDNGVMYNTPVVKNGLVYGISERDILFCINPAKNETTWTTRLEGGQGYGSVVDAGAVLVALNPTGKLRVFAPSDKEYKELAGYDVSSGGTYAYPVLSGNRIFIKDKDSVALWTVE